jgi:predicted secreted hydrolase
MIAEALRALALVAALVPAVTPLGFANANLPWDFAFPRDHAAHDAFASEWWYYTGHLRAPDGRRFGYELTFFRVGMRPGERTVRAGESRWHGNELYPAHFALTDERGHAFGFAERFARDALGRGVASTRTLAVRAGTWTLSGPAPFRLHAAADLGAALGDVTLDLVETAEKPPAVHGRAGISKKGACAFCASHYYSMTRLRTSGSLVVHGVRLDVSGLSWMDHEFGSDELGPDRRGWDWFSIQLADGRELMLYRLRRSDGSIVPESSGSLVDRSGHVTALARSAFAVEATGTWTSPHSGAVYPSGWRVRVPAAGVDLILAPVLADQELAGLTGGITYWEGAVDVRDHVSARPLGRGYVELTGYARPASL